MTDATDTKPVDRPAFKPQTSDTPWGKTVNPPIERASTRLMAQASDLYSGEGGATYGRHGHAVHEELKAQFTALDGGAGCSLTPSGVSAVTAALLGLCDAGAHVLISDSVYGPTRRTAFKTMQRFNIEAECYDPRIGADIAQLIRPNTALIMLESPGSLTFEIQDIPAIVSVAQAHGVLTAIDHTWGGGVYLKPLALGVDVAINAATKYPSGSSDVFMGAVVSRTPETAERISAWVKETGLATSPDDAYLVLRGMRTLELRMRQHDENARRIAAWLSARPEIARVLHPAFESHPDHDLWQRDFTGAGSLFACTFQPISEEAVLAFLDALEVFGLGFSYGGFESLAIHCAPQLVRTMAQSSLEGPLVRFAIGLEDPAALEADLERGFAAMRRVTG